jgi:ketosteroid isomerase-like protein
MHLALLVFLTTSSAITWAQRLKSSEGEVVKFVEKYDNAWNHKDATAIESILAPEYVYFTSKGGIESRQALIDELMSPTYKLASAERSEMKVYFASGTAVVSSRWKGRGTYNHAEFHDDQRCSIVLARDGQSWQVLSEHCTQIANP